MSLLKVCNTYKSYISLTNRTRIRGTQFSAFFCGAIHIDTLHPRNCVQFSTLGKEKSSSQTVQVTFTKSDAAKEETLAPPPRRTSSLLSDETKLVDSLLQHTASLIDKNASNIIAFSGGVDSSLAAALVHRSFQSSSSTLKTGHVKAVLGVSASLPDRQLSLARNVAASIGIDLEEAATTEGMDTTYVENNGQACLVCKSHLYAALEAVTKRAAVVGETSKKEVILFNGTNADDTNDPTRLGLIAADNFSVRSPLINISKDEVRRAARHLSLPNWDYAASPCLRSRLALGVEATTKHLQAVSLAEDRVRDVLCLDETMNLRVRMLAGKKAMVEVDQKWFENEDSGPTDPIIDAEILLKSHGFDEYCKTLGFEGGMGVRPFKSGAVSR